MLIVFVKEQIKGQAEGLENWAAWLLMNFSLPPPAFAWARKGKVACMSSGKFRGGNKSPPFSDLGAF